MDRLDLGRLFETEAPRLLRRLRRFRGRIDAEEVVQAAFARMLELEASEIEEPRAYLARVTRNLAVDELRRNGRTVSSLVGGGNLEDVALSGELTPEAMLIEGERFAHMLGVVLALPEKERQALIWFKLKRLSHAEIAQRLGVSRHSVPRYLSRALAKCAAAMAAFEDGLDVLKDHLEKNERR